MKQFNGMSHRLLSFLLVCLSLSSCEIGEESTNGDHSETLAWIENTMNEHYYWYEEMPKADVLYYGREPDNFFYSLLSDKDGKKYLDAYGWTQHAYYSTIENLAGGNTRSSINEDYSYGFEFTTVYASNAGDLYALVLYVQKNSPAYEAGLKRGDWIVKMNDNAITNTNFESLYGDAACSFTIAKWNPEEEDFVIQPNKVEIASARPVEDNPVYLWEVIQSPVTNKRVGYLVYNHFTVGRNNNDTSYDDMLRQLSATEFNGVEEFVLDLRYNNGGALSSGVLLCSILQPQSAFGTELGYLMYNDKQAEQQVTFKTGTEVLGSTGRNLNLKTVYVLVSQSTASASEMVINSLKPFMNVVVIGETTVGKNVGSTEYISTDKMWAIHPIVCQLYNSDGFTDYADGIRPDKELMEAFVFADDQTVTPVEVFPLGDLNERMLKAAIEMIDGTPDTRSIEASGSVSFKKTPINSIDRKATGSVIINTTR